MPLVLIRGGGGGIGYRYQNECNSPKSIMQAPDLQQVLHLKHIIRIKKQLQQHYYYWSLLDLEEVVIIIIKSNRTLA